MADNSKMFNLHLYKKDILTSVFFSLSFFYMRHKQVADNLLSVFTKTTDTIYRVNIESTNILQHLNCQMMVVGMCDYVKKWNNPGMSSE